MLSFGESKWFRSSNFDLPYLFVLVLAFVGLHLCLHLTPLITTFQRLSSYFCLKAVSFRLGHDDVTTPIAKLHGQKDLVASEFVLNLDQLASDHY